MHIAKVAAGLTSHIIRGCWTRGPLSAHIRSAQNNNGCGIALACSIQVPDTMMHLWTACWLVCAAASRINRLPLAYMPSEKVTGAGCTTGHGVGKKVCTCLTRHAHHVSHPCDAAHACSLAVDIGARPDVCVTRIQSMRWRWSPFCGGLKTCSCYTLSLVQHLPQNLKALRHRVIGSQRGRCTVSQQPLCRQPVLYLL